MLLVFCCFSFVITKQHISHTTISLSKIIISEQEIYVILCWVSGAGVFGIFSIGAAMQLWRRVFAAVAQWLSASASAAAAAAWGQWQQQPQP